MYRLEKMKNHFDTIQDVKDLLVRKIFVSNNDDSYIFEEDEYAIMQGDFRLLISRGNIEWGNIDPKHKYPIFQYESSFIFRTSENEIFPGENEFIILIEENKNGEFSITFNSLDDRMARLRLLSD